MTDVRPNRPEHSCSHTLRGGSCLMSLAQLAKPLAIICSLCRGSIGCLPCSEEVHGPLGRWLKMRHMKMLGTVIALSLVAGCGEFQGVQNGASLWSQTTAQVPMSNPGPPGPPTPKDDEPPPSPPPPKFHGEACISGSDDQEYSYEFCYSAQSEGFYADITNAPPRYTDIRLKEARSQASIKNTTPNRQAPPKLMMVAFRALYNMTSPVCTTKGVGTGIYIGTEDTPGYCSMSWAGYAQNARGISMDMESVTELSSRSSAPLENIPESSAPALIHALHEPHSLVLLIDMGDRDVLHLPKACQVEVRSASPHRRPFVIPVEGYEPVC